MNTKIQLGHIYRARNGSIHRVTQIITAEPVPYRPVITEILSDPTDGRATLRTFTEYGYAIFSNAGTPQEQHPSDLIEDITATVSGAADAPLPASIADITTTGAAGAAVPGWLPPAAFAGAILLAILAVYSLGSNTPELAPAWLDECGGWLFACGSN